MSDYIEMFYNPKRRHGYNQGLAPVEFETQYFNRLGCVYRSRGDSLEPLSATTWDEMPSGIQKASSCITE